MNNTAHLIRFPHVLLLGLLPAAVSLSAADAQQQSRNSTSTDNVESVRITRATNFLGTDVMSTDNRKVGDIVDFIFDVSQTPHLAYAIVMTGGFLNVGGDTRAVPAKALSTEGDTCHVSVSSAEYWDVPVLPQDRTRFLSDAQHLEDIATAFGIEEPRETQGSSNQFVAFSALSNEDIYGSEGDRLGYVVDAWISLDADRSPYVEITPTLNPFRIANDLRYAIPTASFDARQSNGYTFDLTASDLREAESISETEGVKRLETGEIDGSVLRVRVAQL